VNVLRLHGVRDLRLEDVRPPDEPGPGEVLVAPQRAGICGTDLREYTGPGGAVPTEPHPLTGISKPVILGHEFSARVVAVGSDVTDVKVGDAVAVMPLLHCGECAACLRGEHVLCENKAWTGLSTKWGGFGELAVVPAYQATPLQGLSYEQGAVVEPATVSLHAVERAGVGPGDSVLVAGCGPIGALAILAALASGASAVFFTEPHPVRAALGVALGGIRIYGGSVMEQAAQIRRATKEAGVDAAIDCAGKPAGLELCIEAARMGGTISIPAVHVQPPAVNVWRITRRSLSLRGSQGYTRSAWDRTIALAASGRYPIERIVTSTVPLMDVVRRGFDALLDPNGAEVKVVVAIA
jgi:(R,R)-butanediol dehydrogenase/meso-butanediol dehydrogenase/diacetyl reductase